MFEETGLTGSLLTAVAPVVASVIFAPVCEEILYRGAVLRPIHDHIARRGSSTVAAVVSILVSAVLFALPHLGEDATLALVASYIVSGVAFGLVYVLTGSMTAAMVSHSLQSMAAFGQILWFGRGEHEVSPIIWILVLGCPLWTFLCAKALHAVFPKGSARVSR